MYNCGKCGKAEGSGRVDLLPCKEDAELSLYPATVRGRNHTRPGLKPAILYACSNFKDFEINFEIIIVKQTNEQTEKKTHKTLAMSDVTFKSLSSNQKNL